MIELKHDSDVNKAVLLLHGMTGAPTELAYLGKDLYASGFDVYIPTLPGHCQSTEALKKTTWHDWNNFAISEYDRLKEIYEEVNVSGICLGAVLALNIAGERKSVKRVVCLSTTLFYDGWSIPKYRFMLPLALYTVIKFFWALPEAAALGVTPGLSSTGRHTFRCLRFVAATRNAPRPRSGIRPRGIPAIEE